MSNPPIEHLLNNLLHASGWYAAGTVLRQALAFALLPLYTEHLSPNSYGMLSIVAVSSLFMVSVFTAGLPPAIFRFASDPQVIDEISTSTILGTALVFILLWGSGLALIVASISSRVATSFLGNEELYWVVQLLALLALADSITSFAGIILRLRERAQAYSLLQISQISMQILIAYWLVVIRGWDVTGAILALIAAAVLTALVGFYLVRRDIVFSFSRSMLRQLLRYSVPLLPSLMAIAVIGTADRYVLRQYIGLEAVGIYEAGYRIGKIVGLVVVAVGTAWPPVIYSLVGTPECKILYSRVATYFVGILLVTATVVSVLSRELNLLLTGSGYEAAWHVVPWIAFAMAAYGAATIFQTGLHIAKKTDLISIITVVAALVTVAGCIVIVPVVGILGAAIIILFTYIGMAVSTLWFSQHHFPMNFRSTPLVKFGSLTACVLALGLSVPGSIGIGGAIAVKFAILCLFPAGIVVLNIPDQSEKTACANVIRSLIPRNV